MSDIGISSPGNINNSLYQFDVSLINTEHGKEIKLPIPKGAIEYIEIEDNLSNFGLVGKCRIANFYGILQQLKVLDSTEANLIYIDIINSDFKNSKIDDNADLHLTMLATLQQGVEMSENIVGKSINYIFEEYFVAMLRKQSIRSIIQKITPQNPPGKLIYDLLTLCNKESTSELSNTSDTNTEFMLSDELPNYISLSELYTGGKIASVFDMVSELYNFVTFGTNVNNVGGGPGIISSTNILEKGLVKRMFTLQPLSHLTNGLYEKLQQNAEDLSNYVAEEFIVGDAASANAPNTNFIDNYAFLPTNYTDVLSNKWIDYTLSEITTADPTIHVQTDVSYENVKFDFAKEMLNGTVPNLPEKAQNDIISSEEPIMVKQIKKKVSNDLLTKQYVQNIMKKSFVFDNQALTFTVPGNTYRKTGKFIKIKAKEVRDKSNEVTSKSLDGYWFIILLKHIFKGDYYTNEYTCVKLHTEGKMSQPSFVDQANSFGASLNSNPLANIFSESPEPLPISTPPIIDNTNTTYQERLNTSVSTTAVPENNGVVRPTLDMPAPNLNQQIITETPDPANLLNYINGK